MPFFDTKAKERVKAARSPHEVAKARRTLVVILILAVAAGLFVFPLPWNSAMKFLNAALNLQSLVGFSLPGLPSKQFQLGLDIAGGTSLTYRADLAAVEERSRQDAMEGLRDVVERRVNLFGVREPRVETAKAPEEWRLIVELAGIKDVHEAINVIGDTPFLEFREEMAIEGTSTIDFAPTALTGKYLDRAELDFDQTTYEPVVNLQFDDEGKKLFAELTQKNVQRPLAIYLDGAPISIPVVREPILEGRAQISGNFTVDEAKQLVRRLNEGALPVPVSLIEQRTVGAILGQEALQKSVKAGMIGFLVVGIFMTFYYRRYGIFAVVALMAYALFALFMFKVIPVTLTLAGIAGFILSIGMAVDANILIFERTKEEKRLGRPPAVALKEGFSRAWPSIRDSNISTIITSIVLYTFATSIVKGFALTLLVGVLISMFSAIFVTRTLLMSFLRNVK